ncbi:MAG: molecular chaperone HtpG [Gammaproteobacteria bacterium]
MSTEGKTTLGFQAEVKQLLHLMIHSLYSNREIFLRELISNASDANDRLRFAALSDPELTAQDERLEIRVSVDKEAGTLIITDTGIGMSRDEVISQLGTIARSGTGEFLKQLSGDDKRDSQLIGQFGVGFYSSFIVADSVEVVTRRADLPADDGVRWQSNGEGEYTVESVDAADRGTSVILHLREESREFLEEFRIRGLITRYSDHIAFPVNLQMDPETSETVNRGKALWARSRADVTDDEHIEFYKYLTHDLEVPLIWSHNRVEGKREYTSLLYIPGRAPFDLWNREAARGLKLYVQRVFIMDDAEQFLPLYLRFVRGVVDCNDLSLNVSRELLQQDEHVASIRRALTRRVLDVLARLANDEADKYVQLWDAFGAVLKEGVAEETGERDKLFALLRFTTTESNTDAQDQSLNQYIDRMQPDQNEIYYLVADSLTAGRSSPHLEAFKSKNLEVLLLSDRIDPWMIQYLSEFDGKTLRDISRGALDLDGKADGEGGVDVEPDSDQQDLLKRCKRVLRDQVDEVRLSRRLTDSAVCLVLGDDDPGPQIRQLMEAAGQTLPETKPSLELNPQHPLYERLNSTDDNAVFENLVQLLFGQALLVEGRVLPDPGGFVQRMNKMLLLADQPAA